MSITVFYGRGESFTDVTETLINSGSSVIPKTDQARARLFGIDPLPGVMKVVRVQWPDGRTEEYGDDLEVGLDGTVSGGSAQKAEAELQAIHRALRLVHGSMTEEYPEQLMSVRFIGPRRASTRGVLEIGGNVGRNSCAIASVLGNENAGKLVVVEPCLTFVEQLKQNRDINGLSFNMEPVAISRVPLMHRSWETRPIGPSGVPDAGWTRVDTVCWEDLRAKWADKGVVFDTLVVDCEGALYYILKEDPTMLEDIELVLIENDFVNADHKAAVDAEFERHGLTCVYRQAGGWGPCQDRFYEAWARAISS
jgi:FkbM family methyltransferase